MNGLIYLLNQAGEALAAAEAQMRELAEENAALRAQLEAQSQ